MKAGKTTAADLVCEVDPRFERASFATIMKDMYAEEKGLLRSELDDVLGKEKHRKGMQAFGDSKRDKDPFIFARGLANILINRQDKSFVIDDCRYIEELSLFMKEFKAIPYAIFADPARRAERGWKADPVADNHLSETELGSLNSYTWSCLGGEMLYNNKTKEDLKNSLLTILKSKFPYTLNDLPNLKGIR